MTALCGACLRDYVPVAFKLIKAGSRVNIRDNHGNGPLHYAARNGNIELCKELLAKGKHHYHISSHS